MCMHAKLAANSFGMSSQKFHNPLMSGKYGHMIWFRGLSSEIWFNGLIQSTHYDAKKQHNILEQALAYFWTQWLHEDVGEQLVWSPLSAACSMPNCQSFETNNYKQKVREHWVSEQALREDMDARDGTLINTNIVTPPSTGFGTAMGSSSRVSDWQVRHSVLTDEENCPRIPKKKEKHTTSSGSSTACTMSECNNTIVLHWKSEWLSLTWRAFFLPRQKWTTERQWTTPKRIHQDHHFYFAGSARCALIKITDLPGHHLESNSSP